VDLKNRDPYTRTETGSSRGVRTFARDFAYYCDCYTHTQVVIYIITRSVRDTSALNFLTVLTRVKNARAPVNFLIMYAGDEAVWKINYINPFLFGSRISTPPTRR